MDSATFLFVGVVALIWTLLSALPPRLWDEYMATAFTFAASVFWALWAISATEVTVYSGGQEFTHTYESLLFLFGAFALFLFVVAIGQAIELLKHRGESA